MPDKVTGAFLANSRSRASRSEPARFADFCGRPILLLGPDPAGKVASIPRKTLIQANIESVVATDFFTKPVQPLRGTFTTYVLVFIHLGSRKTYCSPATDHPDAKWVVQQSRNAALWLDENGIQPRFARQDRDTKFADCVRDFWRSEGARPWRTPIRAPTANAFVESFIGTLNRERLNYFVCFSRSQLDYIVRTWIAHYNTERPHRRIGMNNEALDKGFRPRTHGPIRCKPQLGGLIKSYYREAA